MRVQRTAPDTASGRTHPREDQASQHQVPDARAGSAAPRRAPGGRGAASATGAAPAATGQEDPTRRRETRRRRLPTRTAHGCRGASNMGGEPSTASPGGPRWEEPLEGERCATAGGAGCAAARSGREDLPMEERLREELLPKTEDQQEPYEAAAAYYCQVGRGRPAARVGRSRPGAAQALESDASERSRRSRRGAVQEPAHSPKPATRARSRRPRDTRSQSRSHSAKRSPRR